MTLKNFVFKKLIIFLTATIVASYSLLPFFNVGTANAAPVNLIANPLVETSVSNSPTDWQTGGWGTNSTSFSYLKTGSTGDNNSLNVKTTAYTSGDAKWYFSPVNVTAGQVYIFSDYYESTISSQIDVAYTLSSGQTDYIVLGSLAASSTWQKFSTNFTVPSGVVSATIYHLIAGVGSLTTDDFSLATSTQLSASITSPTASTASSPALTGNVTLSAEATYNNGVRSVQFQIDGVNTGTAVSVAPYNYVWNSASTTNGTHKITALVTGDDNQTVTTSPVSVEVSNTDPLGGNLIPNPLMETANPSDASQPQDWSVETWGTNTFTSSYGSTGCSTGDSGCVTINMTKYTSGDAKWAFTPQVVTQDTQYVYSEKYKSTVQTQVDAVFAMSDGSTVYEILGLPYVSTGGTVFTSKFSVPYGAKTISIYHLIEAVGSLTFDDASITPYTPTGFSRPIVTLTFDDGYQTEYTNALPLLKQYGFTSTQFIITDEIGKTGFMTAAELKAFTADGDEMASHTVTHDDLTQETTSALNNEMTQSQATLKTDTGVAPTDFAYPYGLYNANVVTAAKTVYKAARGVESGLNSKDNYDQYDLKVENVYTVTPTADITDWVAQAKATNTWLILVYHGVDTNVNDPVDGDIYDVPPAQLSAQLGSIKASGVTVETMSQAIAEVTPQL
jgi:peptidoglycan/xylan/chitin deacetylase (PgdA/CDA1 family)